MHCVEFARSQNALMLYCLQSHGVSLVPRACQWLLRTNISSLAVLHTSTALLLTTNNKLENTKSGGFTPTPLRVGQMLCLGVAGLNMPRCCFAGTHMVCLGRGECVDDCQENISISLLFSILLCKSVLFIDGVPLIGKIRLWLLRQYKHSLLFSVHMQICC